MPSTIIEIQPKKASYDPMAKHVRSELLEAGEIDKNATVFTSRLYKIQGEFSRDDIQTIAQTLLVDPVVEIIRIEEALTLSSKKKGLVLDVWPKPGVTDPVGETVEKGLRDLGYKDPIQASSGHRYFFPTIKNAHVIKTLAQKFLTNDLIHDTSIRNAR